MSAVFAPLLCAVRVILYTLWMSLVVLWRMLRGADRVQVFDTARDWAGRLIEIVRVDLSYELPAAPLQAPAYLLMSTHSSHFDVPALFARSPLAICPVAKQELGSIPLFGWALRRGVAILIDRRSRASAEASLAAAAEEIRAGASVLMFPEGTRTPPGELGSLKRGPFHLAHAAQVPILPVAIVGSAEVLPIGSWRLRPGPIRVRFGEPIDPSDFPSDKAGREALIAAVEQALRALLEVPSKPEQAA